jgi:protein-S-isoprenylcysteine O-methyltransferase Ste14
MFFIESFGDVRVAEFPKHKVDARIEYRFSRNPIYLAFILLVLGLSAWLNNLWLLVMLVPAAASIALVVIPREERFLKQNFHEQYSSYQAAVRRWL